MNFIRISASTFVLALAVMISAATASAQDTTIKTKKQAEQAAAVRALAVINGR